MCLSWIFPVIQLPVSLFSRPSVGGRQSRIGRARPLWAFKQTLALSPDTSEHMKRFVVLLKEQERLADARLVLEAGLKFNPDSKRLGQLAEELKAN